MSNQFSKCEIRFDKSKPRRRPAMGILAKERSLSKLNQGPTARDPHVSGLRIDKKVPNNLNTVTMDTINRRKQ